MEKIMYETPLMEVVRLEMQDIVTDSDGINLPEDGF